MKNAKPIYIHLHILNSGTSAVVHTFLSFFLTQTLIHLHLSSKAHRKHKVSLSTKWIIWGRGRTSLYYTTDTALSLSLSLSHTHTHTHTHTHKHTEPHTHNYTHAHSLSFTHTCMYTHTDTLVLSLKSCILLLFLIFKVFFLVFFHLKTHNTTFSHINLILHLPWG